MRTIAVLGPGGVGGLVAAALSRAGNDVVVVAREETAAAIARDGIRMRSVALGDFAARPAATARLEDPVDALLVAAKATTLGDAVERIGARPGLVVPLLNGVDHIALLRERFHDRVAAGVIRVESERTGPGEIVQSSPGVRIDLAADDDRLRAPLAELATALEAAGFDVRTGPSEADVLWRKLARLAPIALATAAFDAPLGAIRDDPRRASTLWAAVEEVAAAARAEGVPVEAAAIRDELEQAHATLRSSMQKDVAAGRPPELDGIAGPVLRAAEDHGLRAPAVSALAARVAGRYSSS
jgi:2-dehydropantoate 2-reductase